MPLRNIKSSEYFEFADAASLRDWLNQFKKTDLSTVPFETVLVFLYETEVLSDGSKVHNIRVESHPVLKY